MSASNQAVFAQLMKKAEEIKFCMLTTHDDRNRLKARPFTTQETRDDGTIWFLTATDSEAASDVQHNSSVALIYVDISSSRYLAMEGVARGYADAHLVRRFWNPMNQAFFPGGADDPSICVLEVNVREAEMWEPNGSKLGQFLCLAKAALGGSVDKKDLGRHVEVNNTR